MIHELDILTQEDTLVLEQEVATHELIIFNDDVNTFDFVADMLVKVCEHNSLQAEQCTMLIHYKGKCSVKNGEYEKLKPLCQALLEVGLSAEISS